MDRDEEEESSVDVDLDMESEHGDEPPPRPGQAQPPRKPDNYTFTLKLGKLKISKEWNDLYLPAGPRNRGAIPVLHPDFNGVVVVDPDRPPANGHIFENPAYRFGPTAVKQKMVKIIKMMLAVSIESNKH
ncbi:hypothetical protein HDU96_007559 [Phlyctochytrium bullatum]|nr:hypothetical protein HDU96_007559 [Phlyctochytrium bullatum]